MAAVATSATGAQMAIGASPRPRVRPSCTASTPRSPPGNGSRLRGGDHRLLDHPPQLVGHASGGGVWDEGWVLGQVDGLVPARDARAVAETGHRRDGVTVAGPPARPWLLSGSSRGSPGWKGLIGVIAASGDGAGSRADCLSSIPQRGDRQWQGSSSGLGTQGRLKGIGRAGRIVRRRMVAVRSPDLCEQAVSIRAGSVAPLHRPRGGDRCPVS